MNHLTTMSAPFVHLSQHEILNSLPLLWCLLFMCLLFMCLLFIPPQHFGELPQIIRLRLLQLVREPV
jgi:hypothetical protein